MRRLPATAQEREQRKQDLLLASSLVRTQMVGAVGDIGQRVDATVLVVLRLRAWLSDPRVWVIGGAVLSASTLAALPRVRAMRLLHWVLMGWRLLRVTASMWVRRRAAP
jgi:hypothetical protein